MLSQAETFSNCSVTFLTLLSREIGNPNYHVNVLYWPEILIRVNILAVYMDELFCIVMWKYDPYDAYFTVFSLAKSCVYEFGARLPLSYKE